MKEGEGGDRERVRQANREREKDRQTEKGESVRRKVIKRHKKGFVRE